MFHYIALFVAKIVYQMGSFTLFTVLRAVCGPSRQPHHRVRPVSFIKCSGPPHYRELCPKQKVSGHLQRFKIFGIDYYCFAADYNETSAAAVRQPHVRIRKAVIANEQHTSPTPHTCLDKFLNSIFLEIYGISMDAL